MNLSLYAGGQNMRVVKTYICPMDPSISNGMNQTPNGGANGWAACSYGVNNYVFGNPPAGHTIAANNMIAYVTDGLSNTVFFAEKYGTCGDSGNINFLHGSLWADSNEEWRPVFCAGSGKEGVSGYPPCKKFQVLPNWMNNCDMEAAQSPHTAGMNVCLGDGSVRFIAASVSAATWAAACDPRDGVPFPADW